jgi:iron complex outermembrane recepter protein
MRISFLLLTTILASSPALAATTDANAAAAADSAAAALPLSADDGVDNIVVTAQRREQNVQQVPIAVTAIGGDRLLSNAILTANDVARLVPNLTGANGGGRVARPRYFLRGVGVNDPSGNVVSPVGIYVDDVYLGDTAYDTFPLFDLERVEVLRGPQGTLWGKNTIGGAINYVSKKPTFDLGGYARVEAANFGSYAVQGAVGGGLIDNLLAARASFSYEDRGGYYRNLYDNSKEGGVRDEAVRLQFLLTPAPDLEAVLNLHARDLRDGGSPSYKIGTGPGGADSYGYVQTYGTTPRLGDPVDFDAPNPPLTLNSKGVNLNVHYRLGSINLTSITSYDQIRRSSLTDGDSTPNPAQVAHSAVRSHQFTQEVRLASDPDKRLSWTIGGHYFRENFKSDASTGTLVNIAAKPGFLPIRTAYQDTYFNQDTESFAAFGEATFKVTDRFRIAAGTRWTREEKSIALNGVQAVTGATVFNNTGIWWLRNSVSSVLNRNAVQNEDHTWSKVTYSVTPQYDFADNVRGYLRFATGFRSGGYNGNVTSQVAVNTVNPETLTDYEAGIKSEWFNNRLTVNLSAFKYSYDNIQVNVQGSLNGQSATTLRNAANGKISGVEIEISARPTNRLTLRVNGGYLLEAKYTNFLTQVLVNNVLTTVDASGNQIARAPRRTATLDAEYALPVWNGDEIRIGSDVDYRSHIFFNAVTQNDPLQEQGGFALVNARINYAFHGKHLTIGGYVTNLTNKDYYHNNNVPRNGAYSLTLGPPRTYGITATANF